MRRGTIDNEKETRANLQQTEDKKKIDII